MWTLVIAASIGVAGMQDPSGRPAGAATPPPAVQQPAGQTGGQETGSSSESKAAEGPGSGVKFESSGWPVVPDEPAARSIVPMPSGSSLRDHAAARRGRQPQAEAQRGTQAGVAEPVGQGGAGRSTSVSGAFGRSGSARSAEPAARTLPSGMALGSPLLDIYQFTRSPAAFKALGGRQVWWRIKVLGAGGEVLGIREMTQIADCGHPERDQVRYEHDGRVFGRSGANVFAERQGFPWPSDADRGRDELALFGTHLRLPWCFADGISYVVVDSGTVDRPGERLRRVVLERQPLGESTLVGPVEHTGPRDQFEIIYESGTGKPREFAHRFASSNLARRVLLEDWREVQGVRIPHRRIYVDESQRQTTVLEILNIVAEPVTLTQFRR